MAWGDDGPIPMLPPKVPGEHRWIVEGTYTISAEQAARLAGGVGISLDAGMLVLCELGCVDCELGWIAAPARCTAPAHPDMVDCTAKEVPAQ